MPRSFRRAPSAHAVLVGILPFMQVWLDAHQVAPSDLLDAQADMTDGALQALTLIVCLPEIPDALAIGDPFRVSPPRCAQIVLDRPALDDLRRIASSSIDTQAYIDEIRAAAC